MAQQFARNTATIAAATATRLSDILAAEGYTGSLLGKMLEIDSGPSMSDLYRGDSSSVTNLNGIPVSIYRREAQSPQLVVDPSSIWLYSAIGGDFTLTFEPF